MVLTTEHREKLLKLVRLANFLDDLPHDRFHMPSWTSPDHTEHSCGTAGCACGWAATVFSEDWVIRRSPLGGSVIPRLRSRATEIGHAIEDFAAYFGLTCEEAAHITHNLSPIFSLAYRYDHAKSYTRDYGLSNENDITPRHAADRIRKTVAKYDPALLEDRAVPAIVPVAAR